ncbi:MAG: PEGA domain-containing protein [Ferrovibrio sp.]|uniref:PEGA domain-containing protein n=1 Tax=Ferrovibrio sp. TaxID=1917215 RepID=UPI0026375F51|nr:PEGA domain-containing protein [Ferrovibrio sp.]MCW0232862.1 PEGA domain-containing protein [Ferrovibrio sp.]
MTSLTVIAGDRAQTYSGVDFPLAIQVDTDGGIDIGTTAEGGVIAWVVAHADGLSIQPEKSRTPIVLNGQRMSGATWLKDGDVLGFGDVDFDVSKNDDGYQFRTNVSVVDEKAADRPSTFNVAASGAGRASARSDAGARQPISRGKIAAAAVLAILGISIGFVLAASPLSLQFNEAPDTIAVSGFPPAIPVGGGYLALPGTYTVSASKEGYRPFQAQVSVSFGQKDSFKLALIPKPGILRISSIPDKATVLVDGAERGNTPSEIEVDSGERTIRFQKDEFLPVEQKLVIEGFGKEQVLTVELKTALGTVAIPTKPDQAKVRIDGRDIGTSPASASVLSGTRNIEVEKDGWKVVRKTFEVQPGMTNTVPLIELERLDGTVNVETEPSGASVLVNGQFQGQSPMALTLPGEKTQQVSVSKAGFETVTRAVQADPGATKKLTVRLPPETGTVYLTTVPAGSSLKINGVDSGSATQRLTLQTVNQSLEISKPGYEPRKVTVTPQKDVPKKIEITLKTAAEEMKERVAKGILTAAGQKLVLVPIASPIKVALGSPRRDPARRSNENEYNVEMTRPFFLSEKEVTNAEFKKFKAAHSSGGYQGNSLNEPNQPVVGVSWEDAARYANWLSAQEKLPPAYKDENGKVTPIFPATDGYRLPTEAEWEFAARYEGGQRVSGLGLRFTWGESLPPPANTGNFAHEGSGLPFALVGYADKFVATAPVGSFAASKAGLFDLSGNASEWCHDFYDINNSGSTALRDPVGPTDGKFHVIKGSSWRTGSPTELRTSYRDYSDKPRDDVGFRLARYANALR